MKKTSSMSERLNTLRAGVLGSNDGILTVVGVLFSVAVATTDQFTIFIAGLSDLLACAFSMAAGEYASVSTQKDAEKAAVAKEKQLLKTDFSSELATVKMFYVERPRKTVSAAAPQPPAIYNTAILCSAFSERAGRTEEASPSAPCRTGTATGLLSRLHSFGSPAFSQNAFSSS